MLFGSPHRHAKTLIMVIVEGSECLDSTRCFFHDAVEHCFVLIADQSHRLELSVQLVTYTMLVLVSAANLSCALWPLCVAHCCSTTWAPDKCSEGTIRGRTLGRSYFLDPIAARHRSIGLDRIGLRRRITFISMLWSSFRSTTKAAGRASRLRTIHHRLSQSS